MADDIQIEFVVGAILYPLTINTGWKNSVGVLPKSGIVVSLSNEAKQYSWDLTTDEKGNVTFIVPEGIYTVTATYANLSNSKKIVIDQPMDVELPIGMEVQVEVLSAMLETPISGANITFISNSSSEIVSSIFSNEEGIGIFFANEEDVPGNFSIIVDHGENKRTLGIFLGESKQNVTVWLGLANVTLDLDSRSFSPVIGTAVLIDWNETRNSDENGEITCQLETGVNHTFTLIDPFTLENLTQTEFIDRPTRIHIFLGPEPTEFNVSFRLLDGVMGAPINNTILNITQSDVNLTQITTDISGNAHASLPPGNYQVLIRNSLTLQIQSWNITIPDDLDLILYLDPILLSLQVFAQGISESQAFPANITIRGVEIENITKTDENGRINTTLPNGNYSVVISSLGIMKNISCSLKSPILLKSYFRFLTDLTIFITDPWDHELSGLTINLYEKSNKELIGIETTNIKGEVSFSSLHWGEYEIHVVEEDKILKILSIDISNTLQMTSSIVLGEVTEGGLPEYLQGKSWKWPGPRQTYHIEISAQFVNKFLNQMFLDVAVVVVAIIAIVPIVSVASVTATAMVPLDEARNNFRILRELGATNIQIIIGSSVQITTLGSLAGVVGVVATYILFLLPFPIQTIAIGGFIIQPSFNLFQIIVIIGGIGLAVFLTSLRSIPNLLDGVTGQTKENYLGKTP